MEKNRYKQAKKRMQQEEKKKREKKRKFTRNLVIAFLLVSIIGTGLLTLVSEESEEAVIPQHTEKFYINDYSNVYSEKTEEFIDKQAKALKEKTGAQIVVAAVPETFSDSLEDFSLKMARKWGIGQKEEDNGILILYTTKEAHVRLEVGYGLEGWLTDSKAGRILDDYSVESMEAGKWNQAAVDTWIAAAKVVYEKYEEKIPKALEKKQTYDEKPGSAGKADAKMPQPVITKDDRPIATRLFENFIDLWLILIGSGGFLFVLYLLGTFMGFGNGGSGGDGNSGYGGGSSGGDYGGGGDFGGGGASR